MGDNEAEEQAALQQAIEASLLQVEEEKKRKSLFGNDDDIQRLLKETMPSGLEMEKENDSSELKRKPVHDGKMREQGGFGCDVGSSNEGSKRMKGDQWPNSTKTASSFSMVSTSAGNRSITKTSTSSFSMSSLTATSSAISPIITSSVSPSTDCSVDTSAESTKIGNSGVNMLKENHLEYDSDSTTDEGVFVASLEATTSKPSPVPPIEVSGDVHDESVAQVMEMSMNPAYLGGGTAFKDVREDKTKPLLTTDEFKDLFDHVSKTMIDEGVRGMERSSFVRGSNNSRGEAGKHQYGRITEKGMQAIAERVDLHKDDLFIDLGHGIGNAPLQMALTVGCESRGLEFDEGRASLATVLASEVKNQTDKYNNLEIGKVDLRMGSLQEERLGKEGLNDDEETVLQFVTEGPKGAGLGESKLVLFANNYNDVFKKVRTQDTKYKHHADQYIASFFAFSRPGSILITLSKMTAELGPSRRYLNKKRHEAGLNESAGASYFDVEEFILSGGDNFTWNNGVENAGIETKVYIYTRLDQSADEGGGAYGHTQLKMTGDYSFRDVECTDDRRYRPPFMQCMQCFYERTAVIVCSSDMSTEWRRYTDKSKTDMWKGVDPGKSCEVCWARTEEENINRTLRSGSRGGGGMYRNGLVHK
ncbi:hypothetical protein TrCOL_g5893 [Triparma columacea]|uniref:DOT1 domain-containing protein n=1 Tax=Triparma columacea TaxID=722753 RepID=A0A9W7GMN2_9STRA|nr:hypothetical protein TrCOL_g5893 [Triparma columacea]